MADRKNCNIFIYISLNTPTKRSNAQHLVENEKQLLYEENQKSGNIMQQPMDSYVSRFVV